MPTALRAVLSHLFDDAGLFPPAKLPMAEALAAHQRALNGPYGEVVGPFLCPATRLDELSACVAAGATRPATLGIIGYVGQLDWRRPMAVRGVVQAEAPLDAGMPRPPGRIVPYLELPHRGAAPCPAEKSCPTAADLAILRRFFSSSDFAFPRTSSRLCVTRFTPG